MSTTASSICTSRTTTTTMTKTTGMESTLRKQYEEKVTSKTYYRIPTTMSSTGSSKHTSTTTTTTMTDTTRMETILYTTLTPTTITDTRRIATTVHRKTKRTESVRHSCYMPKNCNLCHLHPTSSCYKIRNSCWCIFIQ